MKHPIQEDFRKFVYHIWKELNLPDPTPVQYDIASYLQHADRRSVIEAFRGVGKSWLTSAFVCWLLLNNPQLKILVVSASKERADAFSSFVKRLINDIQILNHLAATDNQRDSMVAFDVAPSLPDHSPSVKSVGITGQITGSRADVLIADDVEVPNNSATQMMRDKLSEAVKEFDAILKPGGRIIYLGTPQTEMSLYNQLPERGYDVRIWTSRYPELAQVVKYQGRLAPMITRDLERDSSLVGKPVDPKRFDDKDLMERAASYGRAGFALQFMLDTALSDGDRYPLKVADLIVMNLNPTMGHLKIAWAASPELVINDLPNVALTGDKYYRPMWMADDMSDFTGCVMSIDPSGRGNDETGYAVIKALGGMLFLVDAGGILGGYSDETLESLAHIAKKHQVKQIIVEANFGDGMYTQLLKPFLGRIYPCTVEEVKHSSNKEARIIDTLEPVISTHRLVVDERLIKKDYETAKELKYSLFYQMTRITRERGAINNDDRLDALAIAVAYWSESMARDTGKAAKSILDAALDKELKRFMHGILGKPKADGTNWNSYNSAFR
jgi:Holliday junction resolvasome RuvABC endonuclease subunit